MSDLPAEFVEFVRDALLGMYDPSALQANPLLAVAGATTGTVAEIQRFRRTLLDAIELFHPRPGVADSARAWRIYRILELRYIERHDVTDVIGQIALSKSQYHREHSYALQAVARVLWKEWHLDEGWVDQIVPRPEPAPLQRDALQHELGALRRAEGTTRAAPGAVLREICDLLQPLCARRGSRLRLELPNDLPPLPGDRVSFRQALLPILIQAINGSRRDGITVAATRQESQVTISIGGLAPGFQEGSRPVIAESQPFIDALGGALAFMAPPTPGGSSALTLVFPASERATLLVVDNQADFADLVARYLAGQDWDVIGASKVDQAYPIAESRRLGAVLLDVVIPGRDGWDLLAQLKTSPTTRNIPVVICSILDEPEVALSLGAVAYLRKPIDRDRLVKTLESVR